MDNIKQKTLEILNMNPNPSTVPHNMISSVYYNKLTPNEQFAFIKQLVQTIYRGKTRQLMLDLGIDFKYTNNNSLIDFLEKALKEDEKKIEN